MEGWHLIAGQTRAGRLTLRTSNGKRFNWWVPTSDILAAIDVKHRVNTDKVTIMRGNQWGVYHILYFGQQAKYTNAMDFHIKPWSALNAANNNAHKRVPEVYTNMPVYPNFAYSGQIRGQLDKELKLVNQQTTNTLGDMTAGEPMSYLVQVQDYYGNPTSIPEIRFINMAMQKAGKARHRPEFVPLGNGYYKVTLYEVFRGEYQLSSFLWKHSKNKGIMPFDFFSVKVLPAGVDPTKSVSRTLNKEQVL
jgi:hypothetical protein